MTKLESENKEFKKILNLIMERDECMAALFVAEFRNRPDTRVKAAKNIIINGKNIIEELENLTKK